MTNQRSVRASRSQEERGSIRAAHDGAPGRMVEAAPKGKVASAFVALYRPSHCVNYAAFSLPPFVARTSLTCQRRGRITTCARGYYIIGSHTSRDPKHPPTPHPPPCASPGHRTERWTLSRATLGFYPQETVRVFPRWLYIGPHASHGWHHVVIYFFDRDVDTFARFHPKSCVTLPRSFVSCIDLNVYCQCTGQMTLDYSVWLKGYCCQPGWCSWAALQYQVSVSRS